MTKILMAATLLVVLMLYGRGISEFADRLITPVIAQAKSAVGK